MPTPKPIVSARPYQRYEGALTALEVDLFDDAIDGTWDRHTLLEAALIAGGVRTQKQIDLSTARFDALAKMAAQAIDETTPGDVIAEHLFDFMHREILVGGYQLECTDLAATIDRGQFNCVSSTVVFNCLADRFGLAPVGVELPGHAMSRLRLSGGKVDVETTCPSWFRLQHDPQRRAILIAKTIGADLTTSEARPGREVSPVQLVAMIYYNRGVDLLSAQQFAEAAAANAKALRLDPSSETAHGNLLATLNNWAITVGALQDYEKAIDLLCQGMRLDPDYETFTANYVHLYYQWSESLCAANEFEEALNVLRQADETLLGKTRLSQLQMEIYRRWVQQMHRLGDSQQAARVLRQARNECGPAAAQLPSLPGLTGGLSDGRPSQSRPADQTGPQANRVGR